MPSITLTDAARMRFESISFFIVVFLIASLIVRFLWNSLRSDFPRLPRLSYSKALGMVALWALLFMLVLVMISGARELLTPGAWKKDGLTYTLNDTKPPAAEVARPGPTEEARRARLQMLFNALTLFADRHEGHFPPTRDEPTVPSMYWKTLHDSEMRYLYVPGLSKSEKGRLLACEPELFGAKRFVLFTDGSIAALTSDELAPLLLPEGK